MKELSVGYDLLSPIPKPIPKRIPRIPIPCLKTKDKAVMAQWSGHWRVVSKSHLKNLKSKRPNVDHTYKGADEKVAKIF